MDNEDIYLNTLTSGNYPHLDRLFEFIQDQDLSNFNLTSGAYFSKIISSLIKIKPDQILTYIYSRNELLGFLIEHSEYQAFNEILLKVLNF